MKTPQKVATWTLALGMLLSTGAAYAQYGPQQGPPPPGYQGGGGWDAPPRDYQSDIARRGFRDGIDGANKDFGNKRRPNVNNRDEYRSPNVPPPLRRDYRRAFKRGYDVGVRHIMQGGQWR